MQTLIYYFKEHSIVYMFEILIINETIFKCEKNSITKFTCSTNFDIGVKISNMHIYQTKTQLKNLACTLICPNISNLT
jgi:hypothetical protein